MQYIKPEYLIRVFQVFTNPTSKVEFNVNDSNAVVFSVIDNGELTSATLMSTHENADDANSAKDVYEAAFKNHRDNIATMNNEETKEPTMNEKIKIQLTLKEAIAFTNSTVSVNENNEVVATIERNGVTENKILSTHATIEEAEAEKVEHENMISEFKNQISEQVADATEEMNQ